jgi:hypothetical protein
MKNNSRTGCFAIFWWFLKILTKKIWIFITAAVKFLKNRWLYKSDEISRIFSEPIEILVSCNSPRATESNTVYHSHQSLETSEKMPPQICQNFQGKTDFGPYCNEFGQVWYIKKLSWTDSTCILSFSPFDQAQPRKFGLELFCVFLYVRKQIFGMSLEQARWELDIWSPGQKWCYWI